jgi:very-short-patch-repair endonuclease
VLGFDRSAIQRRERSGRLIRLYRGVYAVGHVSEAPEAEWLAAVKACGPGASLSHLDAGELWEFVEPEGEHLPHITVSGNRTVPGIRVHRSSLDPRDVTHHRGIPVTTPARTLVDLAPALTERALRHAVRRAQGRRRISLPHLLRTLDRLGPRRGTKTLRKIIATGPAPTRSVLEDVVPDLLLAAGFEHSDVNEPIVIDGHRVLPDFRWPQHRLILEADGPGWHDRSLDAERQALLEAHGERVVRITWEQATIHRAATTKSLTRLLPSPRRR